jgi:hypothetical protein
MALFFLQLALGATVAKVKLGRTESKRKPREAMVFAQDFGLDALFPYSGIFKEPVSSGRTCPKSLFCNDK